MCTAPRNGRSRPKNARGHELGPPTIAARPPRAAEHVKSAGLIFRYSLYCAYAITPQQLPHPRECFYHLVTASGSAKVNTKHGVGVLYKIVACARMRFSSVRKRRSARTVFRPRRFWQNLRAARANRIFCTDKNHPCRKYGYAITPQQLPHPRECFCHFGCGKRPSGSVSRRASSRWKSRSCLTSVSPGE